MTTIGTAKTAGATKLMMLGSGELGKEVVIEAQRFGIEVIAVDRYADAPAMQVAHRCYIISMKDGVALREIIEKEKPHFIVPEIEAIATDTLVELEKEGHNIIPTARATQLTMDREGIRRLAAEELALRTSPYKFADSQPEFLVAVEEIGFPCVVKPVMSSSGKGQSVLKEDADVSKGWQYSQEGARGGSGRVIVEGFVDFDYEITLLTVRHKDGTSFCAPVGHRQVRGDYHESWQPQPMTKTALDQAQDMAKFVTDNLGGYGLFGVEFFVKGDEVYFSEISPRPHDTGMVTMVSQNLSEFALHVRAILNLTVPVIEQRGPSASTVILGEGESKSIQFSNVAQALTVPTSEIRLFGKPEIKGERRLGVALARGETLKEARGRAEKAAKLVEISY